VAVTVTIEEGTGRAPSVIEADEIRAKEDQARRRKEALEHPARKLLSETFGEVTFKEPEVE
jgi:hypothetical protein